MDLKEFERIQPHATNAGIQFFTPSSHVLWRVQTLLTKEKDTIAWIDSMPTDALFLDVGANIGQYSLYAAKRGLTVHAFEPESQNFALLCRNIILNEMAEKVTAWPICLSNEQKLDILHLSGVLPGGSCHSFGQSLDYHGQPKAFPAKQGSFATTLDLFLDQFPPPPLTYLKIDVDGFEHLVVEGAINHLPYIESLLVEINTSYPAHNDLVTYLQRSGFTYSPEQAVSSRRKEGPFTGVGNIVFYRHPKEAEQAA